VFAKSDWVAFHGWPGLFHLMDKEAKLSRQSFQQARVVDHGHTKLVPARSRKHFHQQLLLGGEPVRIY
jgi:hypothetical protein